MEQILSHKINGFEKYKKNKKHKLVVFCTAAYCRVSKTGLLLTTDMRMSAHFYRFLHGYGTESCSVPVLALSFPLFDLLSEGSTGRTRGRRAESTKGEGAVTRFFKFSTFFFTSIIKGVVPFVFQLTHDEKVHLITVTVTWWMKKKGFNGPDRIMWHGSWFAETSADPS